MSFLDIGKQVSGIVNNVGQALGLSPKPTPTSGPSKDVGEKWERALASYSYEVISQNWYSAKPYGFKLKDQSGRSAVMFLPINPSNISITTNFATNMIPTLYGTIEEHSPVRYYDISIEGTTGFAPKYTRPSIGEPAAAHRVFSAGRSGRSSFSVSSAFSLGGFFPKTLATITKVANKAADLLDGGPSTKMGITNDSSGYVAFHNLYRFLLYYKKVSSGEIAGSSQLHKQPLTFFNYKDNNEYYVVVRNFTLRRSAENPMLYNYSIQMRGYNLRAIGGEKIQEDYKARLENLGLNGVKSSSLFGSIKNISSGVKSIVGSAVGGISIFGR